MIARQFHGVSAKVDITIGDRAVNYRSIVSLMMELDECLHDYLCVSMSGVPPRAVTDYSAAPVHVKLSYGANYVTEFHGTVADVEPEATTADGLTNSSPFTSAKLHCFGASYGMRGPRAKVWEFVSVASMAKRLADTYGFSLDVPAGTTVYPLFVQNSESDWKALTRFSRANGYRVNVHGTHMHVYDPQRAYSRNRSFHKVRTIGDSGPSNAPGKLMKFRGLFGREARDGSVFDTEVSVLQADGTQYEVTAAELTGNSSSSLPNQLPTVVDTYSEAKDVLRAEINAKYDYTADITCLGLAGAVPGGVIDLSRYRAEFDGLWYVHSVKHTVHTSAFITELKVSRNVKEMQATNTAQYTTAPGSVWRNGRWETRNSKVVEYG